MTERDALLAAIRANPDDDTPRLVFADWLDEHEPDAKPRAKKAKVTAPSSWAGLIRAECELARLEGDDSASAAVYRFFAKKDEQSFTGVRWDRVDPGVARRVELRTLANRLRGPSAKARKVGRPRSTLGAVWDTDTHRGFTNTVRVVYYRRFAERFPPMIATEPRVRLAFDSYAPPPDPYPWIAPEIVAWSREIVLNAHMFGTGALVAAMSALPEAMHVRTLRFPWSAEENTPLILKSLAESPNWSGLRELEINASSGVSPDLLGRVLRAPHLRQLRCLDVSAGANLDLAALEGLTELRELALNNMRLDDADAEWLANTPALANLRYLNLENNRIGGRGASALIAAPHLKNLAVLDLDHNPVRGLDRAALASAPAGGLRTIGFHGARLTVSDVTALTTSPRLSELVYFDADANHLAESAVARLVNGFGERPPAVLYLGDNGIAKAGVEALTNWPAAARIDMLHLFGNTLPTTAAKALARCPHLKGLNHLCASATHPAGRNALKKCFGKRAFV